MQKAGACPIARRGHSGGLPTMQVLQGARLWLLGPVGVIHPRHSRPAKHIGDQRRHVKLMDFGIAQNARRKKRLNTTRDARWISVLHAPEQIRRGTVNWTPAGTICSSILLLSRFATGTEAFVRYKRFFGYMAAQHATSPCAA